MKRFLITLFLALTFCSSSYAVDELDATKPANSDLISTYPGYLRETRTTVNEIIDSLDQAYIGTNGSYGYVGVANSGKITWSSASPTDGTWSVGDICFNSASSTENDYWICSTAGTPGTWRRSDYSDTLSNTELANFVPLADVKRNINQADENYGRSTTATNVTASTTSSVFGSGNALLLTSVTSTNSYLLGYTTLLNGLSAGYYTFVFDLNVISATTATVATSTSGDSYTTTLAQGHHIVSIPFYFDGSTNTNCSVVVSTPSAGTQCSIESIRVLSGVKSISTMNTLILASSVPASGTWLKGDKAFSTADSRGMWACTAGGTPGTWVVANGDVSKVGTPTNHQVGIWTGDGTLKGLSVTGSKVMCTDANGEPVACTNLTDTLYVVMDNVRSIGEWSGDLGAAVAALDVADNTGESYVIVIDQATTMSGDVDLSSLSHATAISIVFLDTPDAVITLGANDLTIDSGPAEYDFSHFDNSSTGALAFNYAVKAVVKSEAALDAAISASAPLIVVVANIDLTAEDPATWEIPSGTALTTMNGAVITTDATHTLTFASGSKFYAGNWQCFSGAGVSFGNNCNVLEVNAMWWGLVSDGSTAESGWTDNGAALSYALAASAGASGSVESSGATLLIPKGWFCFTTPLTYTDHRNLTIRGMSRKSTILDYRGDGGTTALSIDGSKDSQYSHIKLENFILRDASDSGNGAKTRHGLDLKYIQTSTIQDIDIRGFNKAVVLRGDSHINTFLNVQLKGNMTGVSGVDDGLGANHNSFIGCWFLYNATNSFDGTYVNNTTFIACDFEPNNGTLILNNGNSLVGCRMERNLNATTWLQITGDSNKIDNLLVAASGGYNAGLIFDVDGNYNTISAHGRAGGNIADISGNYNSVGLKGGSLFGNSVYYHIKDTGTGNTLKTPCGSIPIIATSAPAILNGTVKNEILYSSDFTNAAWEKTQTTLTGNDTLTNDTGFTGGVSQTFTASADGPLWISFDHRNSSPYGQYVFVRVTKDPSGTPVVDSTVYYTKNTASFYRGVRVSPLTISQGDEVKVEILSGTTYAGTMIIRNVMVSMGTPLPYTHTIDSNNPSSVRYPDITTIYNPDSLDAGQNTSTDVTVSGVNLGDEVIAIPPYDLQGVSLTAYVSAPNTVTINLENGTALAINLGSGTWTIRRLR